MLSSSSLLIAVACPALAITDDWRLLRARSFVAADAVRDDGCENTTDSDPPTPLSAWDDSWSASAGGDRQGVVDSKESAAAEALSPAEAWQQIQPLVVELTTMAQKWQRNSNARKLPLPTRKLEFCPGGSW